MTQHRDAAPYFTDEEIKSIARQASAKLSVGGVGFTAQELSGIAESVLAAGSIESASNVLAAAIGRKIAEPLVSELAAAITAKLPVADHA